MALEDENGNGKSLGIILAINFYYLYELFYICQRRTFPNLQDVSVF